MRFILNKDKVTLEGYFDTNVSGTIKYYEIPIEYDETWENLVIKAIIVNKDEDTGEEISVINNKFFIDKKKSGTYRVGFVGYTIENEQKVYQVSTDLVSFIIDKGAGEIEGVESHDIPTPSEWEVYIAQIQSMVDDFEDKIPTKLSQLQNDNHTIQDEHYVHTDNNFSNEDKTKLDSLENYDDTEIKDDIQEINGDIDEINTNLLNYSLITETGSKIDLEINPTTYVLIAKLYDKNNNLISTSSQIDLPIESMVVSGFYDSVNKKIILTLDNGNTIDIPIGDLISGLQAEITSENKLESDLVDDTNQTNKFVTTQEKTAWNAKYDKPNSGIPKTDLSNEVQASLDKADTAIQESDLVDYVTNDTLEDSQAIQDEKITAIEKQIPTGEVNDTSITLTDSADYWVKEFGIEGNTEQATRSGKNLANINNITNTSIITVANDTITLANNTNRVGYTSTGKTLSQICPNLTVGDVVILTYNTTSSLSAKNYIYLTTADTTWTKGDSKTITQEMLNSTVVLYGGYEETAVISEFMIRLSSITDETYEPYGASPSPDYPSPVNTITGDIEVKVQNKNYFKPNDSLSNNVVSINNNGEIVINGTVSNAIFISKIGSINFKNGTYKGHIEITGEINGTYLYFMNEQSQQLTFTKSNTQLNVSVTNGLSQNIRLVVVAGTYNNVVIKMQFEEGSTAGEYIPHQEQNYPISLGDIELCKIGDYQDKIFKAINGNTVYDSLTSEQKAGLTYGNWYKYGAIGKFVLDGSLGGYNTNNNWYYLWHGRISPAILIERHQILSNYLKYSATLQNDTTTEGIGFTNGMDYLLVRINSFTSWSQYQNWFSTNKPIIYYILATPVITQITDTTLINQLNALEEAYTYKGVTHIDTDVETKPYLKVVYRKDIGLILEKIENIEARVSLLE